ncbi:MAG: hypothetical protein H8D23_17660 [Candidatus Brocadiales bacterium]|nr:hypothetical protein [Candidatus Brocadiales bacterium]
MEKKLLTGFKLTIWWANLGIGGQAFFGAYVVGSLCLNWFNFIAGAIMATIIILWFMWYTGAFRKPV